MSDPPPAPWRKSAQCGDSACVEVTVLNDEILVRDSKDPDGPVLRFSRIEWGNFLAGVRSGEFNR